ncbi:hypothetical protein EXZ60_19115, partial [Vibrio sp. 1151_11]|nr:hypothetical protein [Vibrio sp. 1151_11]
MNRKSGNVLDWALDSSCEMMSSRRHLLPSVAPLRTQRATFTALGSSLHEGTSWHPATYKAV